MEAERERAERHLLGLATFHGSGGSGPLPRSQSRERIDARRRVLFERAADTLKAIEALGESDIEPYRRRLGAEIERGHVRQPVIDDEIARHARALLATRLRELAGAGADPGTSAQPDSRHRDGVADFERVFTACADCGVLAEAELSQWRERLCEADCGRTWWLERERRQKRCTLTDLRIVVCGSATRIGGLRIATAELYADGLLLRWDSHAGMVSTRAPAGPHGPPGAGWYPPAPVSLTDDLGTDYLHVQTSQGSRVSSGRVAATSTFATVVPPAATQLVAEIGEQRLTVVLPGARERP